MVEYELPIGTTFEMKVGQRFSTAELTFKLKEELRENVWVVHDESPKAQRYKANVPGAEAPLALIKFSTYFEDADQDRHYHEYKLLSKVHPYNQPIRRFIHPLEYVRNTPLKYAEEIKTGEWQEFQYAFTQGDECAFIVFPYLPGEDLHQFLLNKRDIPAASRFESMLPLVHKLLELLVELERYGVVHRDFTPSNILVHEGKLTLIDFETAELLATPEANRICFGSGTKGYRSPEVLSRSKKFDCRADQYSAAVVIAEMLIGSIPQRDNNGLLREHIQTHLPALAAVLCKATQVEPNERYATSQEFSQALQSALQPEAQKASKKESEKASEKPKSTPKPPQSTRNAPFTSWWIRLAGTLATAGIAAVAYLVIPPWLPTKVTATASLTRTQEGMVRLNQTKPMVAALAPFSDTLAPYKLQLPEGGSCQFIESSSHLPGGMLGFNCIATRAGQQPWLLVNNQGQTQASGELTVAPQRFRLKFNGLATGTQLALNGNTYQPESEVTEGEYQLTASRAGYETLHQALRLYSTSDLNINLNWALQTQSTQINLTPTTGKVRVLSAQPLVTGTKTPASLPVGKPQNLPLGTYEVELSAPTYQTQTASLQVTAQAPAQLAVQLSQAEFSLSTSITPADARLEYQGKPLDPSQQSFAAGRYTFTVSHPEYLTQRVDIELGEGKANKLTANLQPKPVAPVVVAQAAASVAAVAPLVAARQAYEPEMVTIPAGSFIMGDDKNNETDEKPAHRVFIKSVKMMTRELTRGEFAQYVAATGYKTDAERNVGGNKGCYLYGGYGWKEGSSWRSVGFSQTDSHPVVCVSHNDAVAYAKWLSQQTGKKYRLPTEAEWEYAARAGTTTDYSFGASIGKNQANCDGCGSQWDNKSTAPVGSFKENKFGLYDMHGNVWEWVQDCLHDSYKAAPDAVKNTGAAWEDGSNGACNSGYRVLRGGSWATLPNYLRSALRGRNTPTARYSNDGFRLVQD